MVGTLLLAAFIPVMQTKKGLTVESSESESDADEEAEATAVGKPGELPPSDSESSADEVEVCTYAVSCPQIDKHFPILVSIGETEGCGRYDRYRES